MFLAIVISLVDIPEYADIFGRRESLKTGTVSVGGVRLNSRPRAKIPESSSAIGAMHFTRLLRQNAKPGVWATPHSLNCHYGSLESLFSTITLRPANGAVVNEFSRLEIMCRSVRPIERAMREPRMDPRSTVSPGQPFRP
jgi:hypothetical protein